MKNASILSIAVLLSSCGASPEAPKPNPVPQQSLAKPGSAYPDSFWKTWQDGSAEVSAYDVKLAGGSALSIIVFALEPFSNTRRVATRRVYGGDVFPAMKMNMIREYTRGRGDATTVFAALEPVNGHAAGSTTKIVFTEWDWTGTVWRQLLLTGNRASISWRSYRTDEADGQSTRLYEDQYGVPEDCLPMCARRIAWPILRLGETERFQALTTLAATDIQTGRAPVPVKLTLTKERQTAKVPAGSFRTHRFEAVWPGTGVKKTWDVEGDPPHRIIRWQSGGGERAVLLGSARVKQQALVDGMGDMLRQLGVR